MSIETAGDDHQTPPLRLPERLESESALLAAETRFRSPVGWVRSAHHAIASLRSNAIGTSSRSGSSDPQGRRTTPTDLFELVVDHVLPNRTRGRRELRPGARRSVARRRPSPRRIDEDQHRR